MSRASRVRGRLLVRQVVADWRRLAALSDEEWAELVPAAEGLKLLARVSVEAERLGVARRLPDWARDRLASARVQAEACARSVRWEIDRVLRALVPAGIRPVFLKGAAYVAAGLSCAAGRVVADVDILVPEAQLADAERALAAHGWETGPLDPYDERYYREWMHELPPMRHRERGTLLDVHHRILPRTGRVHPSSERLFAHAIDLPDSPVRVLSPPHMVLHAAAHLFQDGEIAGALRDLVDIRDLLEEFAADADFDEVLSEETRALGLGRAMFYADRYVARLCGGSGRRVRSSKPVAPARALMDLLVPRALTAADGDFSAPSLLTIVRAHWLKMAPAQLAVHLCAKAIRGISRWLQGAGSDT